MPPLDPEQAAALALASLEDTLAAAAACAAGRRVVVLDGEPGAWLPAGFEVLPQVAGPLAARMAAAFAATGTPALMIGMDAPQVTPELLDAGLAALADHDAALGPAADGGYWAIGLRRPAAGVFDGVPMSEPARRRPSARDSLRSACRWRSCRPCATSTRSRTSAPSRLRRRAGALRPPSRPCASVAT